MSAFVLIVVVTEIGFFEGRDDVAELSDDGSAVGGLLWRWGLDSGGWVDVGFFMGFLEKFGVVMGEDVV